mmetsp:Transcript_1801/g.4002  ORF Transcript_1801/g.4002 Transcript_1801/m.4002 type:complete len:290 (+) Transcript_1801:1040-1909(+)
MTCAKSCGLQLQTLLGFPAGLWSTGGPPPNLSCCSSAACCCLGQARCRCCLPWQLTRLRGPASPLNRRSSSRSRGRASSSRSSSTCCPFRVMCPCCCRTVACLLCFSSPSAIRTAAPGVLMRGEGGHGAMDAACSTLLMLHMHRGWRTGMHMPSLTVRRYCCCCCCYRCNIPSACAWGFYTEASCRPHAWATPKPINHSFCSALAPALAAVASEAAPDPPAPAPAATARSRPSHSSLLLLLPSAPWPGQPRGQQAPLTQSCPVPRSGSPLGCAPPPSLYPQKTACRPPS